jgi:glycosyltransferase involved in cell wall biosynthesis
MQQPARRATSDFRLNSPPVPRRILLLITDLKIGGTPTVVRELATRLHADSEFQVHVACLDSWGPVADQLRDRGIPVTALDATGQLDFGIPKRLISLIREQNFHTVFSFLAHANAVTALVSPKFPGTRFVQSIQTTQRKPTWHWTVQRLAAMKAEKIVVPSKSVAQAARDWSGIAPEKIVVIPNAVDLAEATITLQPHTGKKVGFIGRLDPVKRIGDLIDAVMCYLPNDVTLHIFGEGPERQGLEIHILSLGDETLAKLHGPVPTPWQALAEIDVLVLPSEAEGFGLVLIEAMAAGVPVVGANVPGIRDVIIDQENGLLSTVGNPKSIANAISHIFEDDKLRARIVAGGLKSVQEKYSWTAVYNQYRALLSEK